MHKMESLMHWEEKSTERLHVIAHQYKRRYKKSEGLLSAFKKILLQLGSGDGVLKISSRT